LFPALHARYLICDEKWLHHRWHWLLSSAGKGGNSSKNAAVPALSNKRRGDWQLPGPRMRFFQGSMSLPGRLKLKTDIK
jgi:hypothetical protein